MKNILYLVGKKFSNLLYHPNVVSIEDLLKNKINHLMSNTCYKLCQGISFSEYKKLQDLVNVKNGTIDDHLYRAKEQKRFVHKAKDENVIITTPTHINSDNYHSFVVLDDECAELSDHVTGQHVPGMIIIEAARQMMLSVLEHYYFTEIQCGNMIVIMNKLATQFLNFLFPLEIEINFTINSVEQKKYGYVYKSKAVFIQGGIICTQIEIEFSTYDEAWLLNHERLFLQRVLANKTALINCSMKDTA